MIDISGCDGYMKKVKVILAVPVADLIFVKKMTNLTRTGCVASSLSHFFNSHQELLQAVSGTALSKNLSEESNARSHLFHHTEKLTNV